MLTVPPASQPLLKKEKVKKMLTETWECYGAVEGKAEKTEQAGGL